MTYQIDRFSISAYKLNTYDQFNVITNLKRGFLLYHLYLYERLNL